MSPLPSPRRAEAAGPAPAELVAAYARGWFPMDEEGARGPVPFYEADPRALLPIERFRVPRSVARAARRREYAVRVDGDFAGVVARCAEREEGTWLTPRLVRSYVALHERGGAHSVECWDGGRLVGGLFGVALGGLFTSESMFHRAPDAGSLALVATAARLRERDYLLWDIQMPSAHTARFGARLVSADRYRELLADALAVRRRFD
jgi:leucyl/phenylalanyl-tRNA---protein transferase